MMLLLFIFFLVLRQFIKFDFLQRLNLIEIDLLNLSICMLLQVDIEKTMIASKLESRSLLMKKYNDTIHY